MLALVSLAVLVANVQIRGGGVTFLNAWLALSLSGLFCVGSTVFFVGGIGWFLATRSRRRGG